MRVLLATDGSQESITAARSACHMLRPEGREADLVCVAPEFLSSMTGWDESKLRERYRRRICAESHRILADVAEALHADGIETGRHLEIGSPQGVLVRLSRTYDLTVVGAKGRKDVADVGLGPVAMHLLGHAAGSVLIGRSMDLSDGFRILIAVDGSAAARNAVEDVASLIDIAGADVTLFHVLETPWLHLGLEQEWFGYDENGNTEPHPDDAWQRRLREEANRILEDARDVLLPLHTGVERVVTEGLPSNEILAEAERGGYDLVVLGATGISGLKHQLTGGASTKVALHAPCSVLVARPKL